MSRLICYSLAVLPLLCFSQLPVITLHEPLESSIIVRRSADQRISTIVRYDIESEPSTLEKLELCVRLEESVQKEVLPLSCFIAVQGSNSNNLDNLPLGNFVVSLGERNDVIVADVVILLFSIRLFVFINMRLKSLSLHCHHDYNHSIFQFGAI
jgi:hypothetical protein